MDVLTERMDELCNEVEVCTYEATPLRAYVGIESQGVDSGQYVTTRLTSLKLTWRCVCLLIVDLTPASLSEDLAILSGGEPGKYVTTTSTLLKVTWRRLSLFGLGETSWQCSLRFLLDEREEEKDEKKDEEENEENPARFATVEVDGFCAFVEPFSSARSSSTWWLSKRLDICPSL